MANMLKKSSMQDIGHLCAHYERSVEKGHYSNTDIDEDRISEDNINFAPTRYRTDESGNRIPIKQTDYLKETIDDIMGDKKLRKDAVKMICWVVDAPKRFTDDMKPLFFQETYNFLVDRYGSKAGIGEDIVLSCYWHKSEKTDHIHFSFMPILDRDGKKTFCAKEVVGREDLRTFHTDLEQYLIEKNICRKGDILNGKTIKDSYGRALSVRELKTRDRERKITYTRGRF